MKKLFLLIALSFGAMLSSCDSNEPLIESSEQTLSSIIFDKTTDQTLSQIFNKIYGSNSRSVLEKTVKSTQIFYDSTNTQLTDTALVITNYNEGGFSIIEKNATESTVLALSDQGEFDTDDAIGTFIIKAALDSRKQRLSEEPSNSGTIEPSPIEPVPDYLGMTTWHGDHYCGAKGYYTTLGQQKAFVKAAWHQGPPFDYKMIHNYFDVAGCGPIAVAQVLNHYQSPKYLNGYYCSWESFQNDSIVTYDTPNWQNLSNAIYEIAIGCKAENKGGSTTVKLPNVANYLKSIGYSLATYTNGFDETTIINNLSYGRPIIVAGHDNEHDYGHAWIIDGFHKYKFDKYYYRQDNNQLCYHDQELFTYYHCKWGYYDGKENGYYLLQNFDWNLNMSFIHNIKYIK